MGTVNIVLDLGTAVNIKKVALPHIYGWSTSILDFDKTDTLPETWEFRYRTSPDGTPPAGAFTEALIDEDLSLVGVRQIELEITLRKDA